MQVQNIECQIAKAQLGHYLAGAGLPEDTLSQLEEHLSSCDECKKALAAKRAELLTMLEAEKPAKIDVFPEPAEGPSKSIAAALRKKTLEQLAAPQRAVVDVQATAKQETQPAKPKAQANWKPLLYSAALAAVLVGMSLFSKGMGGVLGPRVADALPASTEQPAGTSSENTETNPSADAQPPAASSEANVTPTPEKSEQPATEPTIEQAAAPSDATGTDQGLPAAEPPVESKPKVQDPQPKPPTNPPAEQAQKQPVTKAVSAPPKPAVKTAPRPQASTVKAPVKRVSARTVKRSSNRRTYRRPTQQAAPRRSSGIKVYDANGNPIGS